MVARYTRFENKRETGKAALIQISERLDKRNASATKL